MPAPLNRPAMLLEYVIGAALSVGMTIYLVYALLRPERF